MRAEDRSVKLALHDLFTGRIRQARQQFRIHCAVITTASVLRRSIVDLFAYLLAFPVICFANFAVYDYDIDDRYCFIDALLPLLLSVTILRLLLVFLLSSSWSNLLLLLFVLYYVLITLFFLLFVKLLDADYALLVALLRNWFRGVNGARADGVLTFYNASKLLLILIFCATSLRRRAMERRYCRYRSTLSSTFLLDIKPSFRIISLNEALDDELGTLEMESVSLIVFYCKLCFCLLWLFHSFLFLLLLEFRFFACSAWRDLFLYWFLYSVIYDDRYCYYDDKDDY